jgi:hypothetical protein
MKRVLPKRGNQRQMFNFAELFGRSGMSGGDRRKVSAARVLIPAAVKIVAPGASIV